MPEADMKAQPGTGHLPEAECPKQAQEGLHGAPSMLATLLAGGPGLHVAWPRPQTVAAGDPLLWVLKTMKCRKEMMKKVN